ncbi:MAG: hypothetical protein WDO24_21780 [Pseudomonadota bacterium]
MRRLDPVILMVALLGAVSPADSADPSVKVFHVGCSMSACPARASSAPASPRSSDRRGYVADRTIVFERRAAAGQLDKLPALVQELVAAHVDVILTTGYGAAVAAKDGAPGIPIVVTAPAIP